MKTKESMDVFGEALLAYAKGDRSSFYLKDSSGMLHKKSLKRYFKKGSQLSKSERKLISLSYGEILDVGCGSAHYMPQLQKRGNVLGIDISPNVIKIAKINGCKNCKIADIFNFPENKKYDTITFLENNLGIGGSIKETKKLTGKIKKLLKDNGQILAIQKRITNKKYIAVELRPVWKNKIGSKFKWIHIDINFLSDLCRQEGLKLKVLSGNQYSYLIRIVKNN